jgi:membrane protein
VLSRTVARFDAYQRAHRWIGFPVAVVYKFVDDQGVYLTALIAHYAFISLFPLLLIAVTILGFVLQNDPELQQRLIATALKQVPLLGPELGQQVTSFGGSGIGLVIGVVGTLFGGLGVAQAGQNALNTMWSVPRNKRPNPVAARVRSLVLLAVFGTGVLATTVLTLVGGFSNTDLLNAALVIPVSMAANAALFTVLFHFGTTHPTRLRDVAPGAVLAGVVVHLLQLFGVYLLSSSLDRSSALYGLFGVVLGLITWITLQATVVVFCAEIDVVRTRRLWPRALLTPFTDDVDLTRADRAAYTDYAKAQRHKGFETVEVSFAQPDHASADAPDPVDGADRDGDSTGRDGDSTGGDADGPDGDGWAATTTGGPRG